MLTTIVVVGAAVILVAYGLYSLTHGPSKDSSTTADASAPEPAPSSHHGGGDGHDAGGGDSGGGDSGGD